MTQAERWAQLREWYLSTDDEKLHSILEERLTDWFPVDVPVTKGGDLGDVIFSDGSFILWDWDDGNFTVGNTQLQYPWNRDDPLFWPQT
jgi:hypothetical protein